MKLWQLTQNSGWQCPSTIGKVKAILSIHDASVWLDGAHIQDVLLIALNVSSTAKGNGHIEGIRVVRAHIKGVLENMDLAK